MYDKNSVWYYLCYGSEQGSHCDYHSDDGKKDIQKVGQNMDVLEQVGGGVPEQYITAADGGGSIIPLDSPAVLVLDNYDDYGANGGNGANNSNGSNAANGVAFRNDMSNFSSNWK